MTSKDERLGPLKVRTGLSGGGYQVKIDDWTSRRPPVRLPVGGWRVKMNGGTTRGPDTPSWRRIASEHKRLDPSGSSYAFLVGYIE